MRNAPPPRGRATAALPPPENHDRSIVLHGTKPKTNGHNGDLKQTVSYLPDIHRLLPQDPDAEQGLLCSYLLRPAEVGALCAEKEIGPQHFHLPSHSLIFQTLTDLWDDEKPIDFITLTNKLRDNNRLDQCGGAAFITQLFTFLPTAANARHYAEILEAKFVLREIIKVCTEHAARAYDEQSDVPALLNAAERDILAIAAAPDKSRCTARELAAIGLEEIDRRIELGANISGLSTGFKSLDGHTDGLHAQEFIAIAGKSGTGKSALAMQMIEHLALDLNVPCAVWPLEMGRKQLSQRMIYSHAKVNPVPWRHGMKPSESDYQRMTEAVKAISKAPLYVEDSSDCTIQRIRARARRLVAQHGVRVVLIDSLSALHSDTRQGRDNRIREAAECSEGCKEMAKELNITVLLVCHIAKDIARSERPSPSHLRESGKVELDADALWFLYEPDFDADKPNSEPEIAVWIPKQRDGEPFVSCKLMFEKKFTRFRETQDEEAPREPDPELPIK